MRIGIDIDEVVADLTSVFIDFLWEKYGIETSMNKVIEYDLNAYKYSNDEDEQNERYKEVKHVVNTSGFQSKAKPIEGAPAAITQLKRQGHEIYFVTKRPKENRDATAIWLKKNGIPFTSIITVGGDGEKGLVGRRLNLDVFIDDLESNLESMYKYKKNWRKGLLLLDKPWNKEYDGSKFTKVNNWAEILRHIGIQNR